MSYFTGIYDVDRNMIHSSQFRKYFQHGFCLHGYHLQSVETAYDSQGNAYLLTNYDAASRGSIVNQVQRTYNGLGQLTTGQLTTEYQSHSGAVNISTTPKVQYAYSEMAGGANHSRLTSMSYPSGYVVIYNYSIGLNGNISRLSSLSDSTGTLESYDYLGLGTVVRRSHPQPAVDLTFLGTGPGSGADQYVGLDSFGRVIDQNWKKGASSTDRFTYSYDRDGNRLTKGNSVNLGHLVLRPPYYPGHSLVAHAGQAIDMGMERTR